jgi:hypothetical protein
LTCKFRSGKFFFSESAFPKQSSAKYGVLLGHKEIFLYEVLCRMQVVVCVGPFLGGREFLGTLCRAKALSWRPTRTDDGDALGRRILLEGVIEAGVS